MKNGFIKVAAGVPKITVANTNANCLEIKNLISLADEQKVNILTLPELSVTGYTCGDLFFNTTLISSAKDALLEIAEFTKGKFPVVTVGLPYYYNQKLYNCVAVIFGGKILGLIPKAYTPDHNGFNEKRYFESGLNIPENATTVIGGCVVNIGTNLIFHNKFLDSYSFAAEICEDLFASHQIAEDLSLNGALIILNSSATNETVGKAEYRKQLVSLTSKRLHCGYVFASAGEGESTTDMVFGGHCLISENGDILAENKPFQNNNILVSEIDVELLLSERQKNTSFIPLDDGNIIYFNQAVTYTKLTRKVSATPFIPKNLDANTAANEMLTIAANGLKKRIEHTNCKKAVIGISGGLDSTLALLTTAKCMELLGRPNSDILAITMPCFGTTKRTRSNSEILCELLGCDFKEVNITDSVKQHFKDIEQSENSFDVTFENSQARERTQVLMDIANKFGGLVIGTGDLSELALGWATFNGDHMSMYAVNADIPKTMVRSIVNYCANNSNAELKKVLLDILDTPVSPELIPADDKGEIAQKTEDLVGPYELHDFFIYYHLRYGFSPKKIFRLAEIAFSGVYEKETIIKWLTTFARRFMNQQFKRSCLPDGPKVNEISVSPRGDLLMPSDASSELWLNEIKEI